MENNQKLQDLDKEAAFLRENYQALEERAIEFTKYADLRAVSVSVLLLQHLFKLGNDVIKALEMLFTPEESIASAAQSLSLEQILRQNNWPAWLQKRFREDTALGQWYLRLFVHRPEGEKWFEVANQTTIPSKIAELRELNDIIEKIVSRTEVLISFKDEHRRRIEQTETLRTKVSEIPLPWSNYSHPRQSKYLLAHVLTNRLSDLIKVANKAFDEVDMLQANSSLAISDKVMRKYAIDLPARSRSIRRLTRRYQNMIQPLQKRFGVVPHGVLMTSIQSFCLHLEQMDLLLEEAEESLETAA
jgi:hypothetical protein